MTGLPPVVPDDRPGLLHYRCNICGQPCRTRVVMLNREAPSCFHCGSNVRMRSLVEALSIALFGQSIALPDLPHRPDLKGIGMSCWDGYAIPLAQKLGYTNTYYHQEPFFDIRHPPSEWLGQLDFVISSDVFEHIEPPVAIAFAQARRLLKPGGVMIFTVPYVAEVENPGGHTVEHFPNLHDYRVEQVGDRFVLHNTTRTGQVETFEDLVFHGGPGLNLEMRMFAETDLIAALNQAGFAVDICRKPNFDRGIYWPHHGSLPMVARAVGEPIEQLSQQPLKQFAQSPFGQRIKDGLRPWVPSALRQRAHHWLHQWRSRR